MPHPLIIILIYLLVINLAAAVVVMVDKRRARLHQWRVPEKTLFLLAILGGTPGTYLTMKAIRHKTQHKRFMIGLPLIFIAQIGLVIGLLVLRARAGA